MLSCNFHKLDMFGTHFRIVCSLLDFMTGGKFLIIARIKMFWFFLDLCEYGYFSSIEAKFGSILEESV